MSCTVWARGCQTFSVEKEQNCLTVSAVSNPGQRRGPRARAGKFCASKCSRVFAEENQRTLEGSGSLSPLREENQPCSCPSPLSPSPLPTASSLDLGWSKTIVAHRHTPQQIPAVKHLGKCFFFPKKKPQGLLMIPSLQASHPKCSQGLLKVHQHI